MRLVAVGVLLSLAVTSCSLVLEDIVYVTRDAGHPRDVANMRDSDDASDVNVDPMDTGFDATGDVSPDIGFDVHADAPRDTHLDVPIDVSFDAPIDVRVDVLRDIPTDDSAADSGGTPCVTDGDCVPYYCGCAACPPDAITCESPTRSCSLGCPTVCVIPATVGCACISGRCARRDPVSTTCSTSSECTGGQLCCYPCGTAGCSNVCLDPDPMTHGCPLFP